MNGRDFRSIPGGAVPIIGEPKVHEWRPVVSATCNCGKGEPLLLIGTSRPERCTGCGKYYGIAFVHFDAAKGPGASIALAEMTPANQVQSPTSIS